MANMVMAFAAVVKPRSPTNELTYDASEAPHVIDAPNAVTKLARCTGERPTSFIWYVASKSEMFFPSGMHWSTATITSVFSPRLPLVKISVAANGLGNVSGFLLRFSLDSVSLRKKMSTNPWHSAMPADSLKMVVALTFAASSRPETKEPVIAPRPTADPSLANATPRSLPLNMSESAADSVVDPASVVTAPSTTRCQSNVANEGLSATASLFTKLINGDMTRRVRRPYRSLSCPPIGLSSSSRTPTAALSCPIRFASRTLLPPRASASSIGRACSRIQIPKMFAYMWT
mmetsp:Transcript_20529/g.53373  ORF Transcript_20529/g.53373 Transcript_20529/m.53373 type:complete len:289 (+) Transcript_20529:478-1344(+)